MIDKNNDNATHIELEMKQNLLSKTTTAHECMFLP